MIQPLNVALHPPPPSSAFSAPQFVALQYLALLMLASYGSTV